MRVTTIALVVLISSQAAWAYVSEPNPVTNDPNWRPLRDDYKRTWYLFSDTVNDGILNPGDTKLESFNNWWTPTSAATQHNYTRADATSPDYSSPQSQVLRSDRQAGMESYWLPCEENTVAFYMTYSQLDNNDYSDSTASNPNTYDYRWADATQKTIEQQRNMYRNGWAMGWLTNAYDSNGTGAQAGSVKMDIFIHNGKSVDSGANTADFGTNHSSDSRSNPQVAMSNDIDVKAWDPLSMHHPTPDYQDINGNDVGYVYTGQNDTRWAAESDFNDVVDSMEVREVNPYGDGSNYAIHVDDTPNSIKTNLTDGNGNPYEYQDAIITRNGSDLTTGAAYEDGDSDGGVIAGLSGYDYYQVDPNATSDDWGEQQVIRIDFDTTTFDTIDKIKFYDFSDQINPRVIEFDIIGNQVYFNGQALPDNRIYIAVVSHVPEPATMSIVTIGGVAMLIRRRRRK